MKAYRTGAKIAASFGSKTQIGALLNFLIRWGFWSLESDNDYYVSLEDGGEYISLTEKE